MLPSNLSLLGRRFPSLSERLINLRRQIDSPDYVEVISRNGESGYRACISRLVLTRCERHERHATISDESRRHVFRAEAIGTGN